MTMLDVYDSLDDTAASLDELGMAVLTGETGEESFRQALLEYQTQVHALKSNTAMTGALILSKLARLLEVAAAEGNIERIGRLHPVLLEEIARHKEHMSVLVSESTGDIEDEEGELWI